MKKEKISKNNKLTESNKVHSLAFQENKTLDDNYEYDAQSVLEVVHGYIKPSIYVFNTPTVKDGNALKVGFTSRHPKVRVQEWKNKDEKINVDNIYFEDATVDVSIEKINSLLEGLESKEKYKKQIEEFNVRCQNYPDKYSKYNYVYFLDYPVHDKLVDENDINKDGHIKRLEKKGVVYTDEFFKGCKLEDVKTALKKIKSLKVGSEDSDVNFYLPFVNTQVEKHYKRSEEFNPRDEQKTVIEKFKGAFDKGYKKLLMFAVMRFGKTHTSLWCAEAIKDSRLVVIVSAKTDVKDAWKEAVEGHWDFASYKFMDASTLNTGEFKEILGKTPLEQKKFKDLIKDAKKNNKDDIDIEGKYKVALFLTLQDLEGDQAKDKHKELFYYLNNNKIDLLIVDETHFGARAKEYGAKLKDSAEEHLFDKKATKEDAVELGKALETLENSKLKSRCQLHLSGTPYRILMSEEFNKDTIICYFDQSQLFETQKKYCLEEKKGNNPAEEENPYFGFPEMIRFAYDPISPLKKAGYLDQNVNSLTDLFKPCSVEKDKENELHKKFVYEKAILEFLKILDGSKTNGAFFEFLNIGPIKNDKIGNHIVFVLPRVSSCDALYKLIEDHIEELPNLNNYQKFLITSHDKTKSITKYKHELIKCSLNHEKTLSFTSQKLLTGVTIEQWDTMIFAKDCSSIEEYDQAIFRLQSSYIITNPSLSSLASGPKGHKECLKPQTILIDLKPNRMFHLDVIRADNQFSGHSLSVDKSKKSPNEILNQYYSDVNTIVIGEKRAEKIECYADASKHVEDFRKEQGLIQTAKEIPVFEGFYENGQIRNMIECMSPLDSKKGFNFSMDEQYAEEDEDYDQENEQQDSSSSVGDKEDHLEEDSSDKKKKQPSKEDLFLAFYMRLLLFAYLSPSKVESFDNLIKACDADSNERYDDNLRICKNLGIKPSLLKPFLTIDRKEQTPQEINFRLIFEHSLNDINNIKEGRSETSLDIANKSYLVFDKLKKISDAEVITPVDSCKKLFKLAFYEHKQVQEEPKIKRKIIDALVNGEKILDISGKIGEFAYVYRDFIKDWCDSNTKWCKTHGVKSYKDFPNYADAFYTIPSSGVGFEFTLKAYEECGLNCAHIAKNFTSYDIAKKCDEDKKNGCENVIKALLSNDDYSQIKLDAYGEDKKVKFAAVVGNPPYQIQKGGTKNFPIWPQFLKIGWGIAEHSCCFIHPADWVVPTKQACNKRDNILDNKLKNFEYYGDSKLIFEKNDAIDGGVVISYFEKDFEGDVSYNSYFKGRDGIKSYSGTYKKDDVFVANEYEAEVYKKFVKKFIKNVSMDDYFNELLDNRSKATNSILQRVAGNIGSLNGQEFGFDKSKDTDKLKDSKDGLNKAREIWANKGSGKGTKSHWYYIEEKYLNKKANYYEEISNSRKVMLDKKGHSLLAGRNNVINNNPVICNENRIAVGNVVYVLPPEKYKNSKESTHCALIKSYFMTKTIRFVLSLRQKKLVVRGFELVPDYTLFLEKPASVKPKLKDINDKIKKSNKAIQLDKFTDEYFYTCFSFSKKLIDYIEASVTEKIADAKDNDN
ncbi:MAG: Eco57I restriction-modification methylase domain-containing protein [Coriobacteriales bacterium]|nr:Eco57I restriction-modification methylase domain-containing protein [Coriobacteriales bacterium]